MIKSLIPSSKKKVKNYESSKIFLKFLKLFKFLNFSLQRRKKITINDFEPFTIIGRGAFGEVRLCRHIASGSIVAIKKLKKNEMLYKNQLAHVRAERDVLSSSNNPWIVQLSSSFQDIKYLYLVMEYLNGGDLMTLLMKRDILTEEEAKFYIAEAVKTELKI